MPVAGAALSFNIVTGMGRMAAGAMAGAGTGSITIEVDDVDGWYERLRSRGAVVKPPTTQPRGRRSVWLRDPDSGAVNLYQPIPDADAPDRQWRYGRTSSGRWSIGPRRPDAPAGTPLFPAATGPTSATCSATTYLDRQFTIDELLSLDQSAAVRAAWHGVHRETGAVMRQTGLVLFRVGDGGRIGERRAVYRKD